MFLKPRLLLGFAIAFVGGLMGDDPTAILFVVVGTFIPACGLGGRWWTWFVLSLCAWAGGSGVLMLLSLGSSLDLPGNPTELDTIMTVLAALSTAVVGTSLNWAASRMIRLQ
jgi:hypothetical protein